MLRRSGTRKIRRLWSMGKVSVWRRYIWFGGRVSRKRRRGGGGSMKGYLVVERFRVCCACILGGGCLGALLVVVDLAIGLWVYINSCEEVCTSHRYHICMYPYKKILILCPYGGHMEMLHTE